MDEMSLGPNIPVLARSESGKTAYFGNQVIRLVWICLLLRLQISARLGRKEITDRGVNQPCQGPHTRWHTV